MKGKKLLGTARGLLFVLLRIVVYINELVHVVVLVLISFLGPVVVAWVMKKTKWLDVFLYPDKFML